MHRSFCDRLPTSSSLRHRRCSVECLEHRQLLAANLTGQWRADDLNDSLADSATVAAWNDSVADTVATATGTPQLVKGVLQGRSAIRFNRGDGIDTFTVLAADSPMSGAEDFTIAAAFATDTTALNGGTVGWFLNTGIVDGTGFFGTTPDWGLVINSSGQIGAGLGGPASTVGQLATGLLLLYPGFPVTSVVVTFSVPV